MSLQPQTRFTFEDYLSVEREEMETRHEFVDGEVFDMVGASENHNIIVSNLVGELRAQMKGRPCLTYSSDMKVRIESADAFKYPDVVALCGERKFYDRRRDVLLNPSVIIEVLSPSTEAYDRGEKFAIFRRLPSLHEYLLVSQGRTAAELYVRQPDECWLLSEHRGAEAEVPLESIACALSLTEVYDKVEFSAS